MKKPIPKGRYGFREFLGLLYQDLGTIFQFDRPQRELLSFFVHKRDSVNFPRARGSSLQHSLIQRRKI